ncbi:hypothetical protein [Streptomyces mirabilis]|uniref:hypothetical protein n=1 Tax=Streptomyces mirabilis TaxID=68239 RepID=UPI0036801EFE
MRRTTPSALRADRCRGNHPGRVPDRRGVIERAHDRGDAAVHPRASLLSGSQCSASFTLIATAGSRTSS